MSLRGCRFLDFTLLASHQSTSVGTVRRTSLLERMGMVENCWLPKLNAVILRENNDTQIRSSFAEPWVTRLR
jgi:hypothetical protein